MARLEILGFHSTTLPFTQETAAFAIFTAMFVIALLSICTVHHD